MSKIDYEVESAKRMNWMDLTGGTAKDGMTMLDYFAGKAFGAIIAAERPLYRILFGNDYEPCREEKELMAETAYTYAEAMLKERTKRFTPQGTIKGVTGKTYG
jgi:hypothetical protein